MSATIHGRIISSAFRPHPLLRGAHAQTMFGLLRPTPVVHLRRERLELADGDFLDLAHFGSGRGPRVLLIHGLTGSFASKYLSGTARQLIARGMRGTMMQLRGAGPEPNRLPQQYHQGATGDVRWVVELLARREPGGLLAAIGWSLGANLLLKYLGEDGCATPLAAACAVSAPFDLEVCAEHLRTGVARIYQRALLDGLKAGWKRKAATIATPIPLEKVLAVPDLVGLDDVLVAPLHGFRDAHDYYQRCSCAQFLSAIARPTLILHAADDPFMLPRIIPRAEQLAPCVTLELSPTGGHVGFVAADRLGRPVFWSESRIAEFLHQQLVAQPVDRVSAPRCA